MSQFDFDTWREEDFDLTGTELVAERYLLEERIASGSMGEVWRADDTQLHRPVAVKLLHSSLAGNERLRERFASEAASLAALNSPFVATVHDYGEEPRPDGARPYLVMELVNGRPLAELLAERGTLTVAETVPIVRKAAEGLQAAHQAGIVHRDVKPANILITAEGTVKLIDFGIAYARGTTGLTEVGKLMGTLAYVSPDQIADEEPTPSVDIYSLGIVAYECLTGSPPFVSETSAAVLNSHLYQPPPTLPSEIPEPVTRAVLMALRKKREHRWQTVEDFAHQIQRDDDGPPSTALVPLADPAFSDEETGTEQPAGKRTLRVLTTVTSCVVLATIVLWFLAWHSDGRTDHGGGAPELTAETSHHNESDEDDPSTRDDTTSPDEPTKTGASTPDGETGGPTSPTGGDGDTEPIPELNGKHVNAARALLRREGFHNSDAVRTDPQDGHKKCVVYQQSPRAGSQAGPDTTVTYYYMADEKGCGGAAAGPPGRDFHGPRAMGGQVPAAVGRSIPKCVPRPRQVRCPVEGH